MPRSKKQQQQCPVRRVQINLVSDIRDVARLTDPQLQNPWGVVVVSRNVAWTAVNGTGLLKAYSPRTGESQHAAVIVPPRAGQPPGARGTPTGLVFNERGKGFVITSLDGMTSAPSTLLTVTEDGTISGWNDAIDKTRAIIAVTNPTAVYKGAALASEPKRPGSAKVRQFLFVADFANAVVAKYDEAFQPVGAPFTDEALRAAGYAPFNVAASRGGLLFVAFAKQGDERGEEEPGPGNGFISVFDLDGRLVRRFANRGNLNAPWALVEDGERGRLLVGNFGDGRILIYGLADGVFRGFLQDAFGNPLLIDGLWGLAAGLSQSRLVFAAGINDEANGLFGVLRPLEQCLCVKRDEKDDGKQ